MSGSYGRASVKVTPDLTGFKKELEAELKAYDPEVNVKLAIQTAQASAELDAWRARESGKEVHQEVNLDTNKWQKAWAKISKDADLGKLTQNLLRISTLGVPVRLLASFGALNGLLNTSVASIGLFVQLAGGLVLLPALLTPLIGIFATIKLGSDGFKKSIEGLTPALNTLRSSVNRTIINTMAPGIKDASALLPKLSSGFDAVAGAIGRTFSSFVKSFNNKQSIGQLNGLLKDTGTIAGDTGAAFAPLTHAFLNIAAVGLPVIMGMVNNLGPLAQGFERWTASAEGVARIKGLIAGASDALSQIGNIASNVYGIVSGVLKGLQAGGAGLGGVLGSTLGKLNAFVNSAQGLKVFGSIGHLMAVVGDQISNVLGAALDAVGPLIPGLASDLSHVAVILGGALTQAIQAIGPHLPQLVSAFGQLATVMAEHLAGTLETVTPLLTGLLDFIGKNSGWLVPMAAGFLQIYAALKLLSKVTNPVISGLSALEKAFGKTGKAASRNLVAGAEESVGGLGKTGAKAGTSFASKLKTGISAIGVVGLGIAIADQLTGPLISSLTDGKFSSAIDAAIAGYKSLGSAILHGTPQGIDEIRRAWGIPGPDQIQQLIDQTVPLVGKAAGAIAGGWNYALSGMIDNTTKVGGDSVGALLNSIAPAGVAAGAAAGGVVTAWSFGLQPLSAVTSGAMAGAAVAAGSGVGGVLGAISGIGASAGIVGGALAPLPGIVGGAMAGVIAGAQGGVGGFLGAISGTNAAGGIVGGAVAGLPGIVGGAMAGVVGQANGGVGGFLGAISGANRAVGIMAGAAAGVRGAAWVDLNGVGQQVAQGFADGINARAKAAIQAAKQMVVEAVAIAKAAAQVHSPSKAMRDIGIWFGPGLAIGIQSGTQSAVDAAQKMADKVNSVVQNSGRIALVDPLKTAAQEILNALKAGKSLFEDFSFAGESPLVGQFNDQLAAGFHGSSVEDATKYLEAIVSARAAVAPPAPVTPSGGLGPGYGLEFQIAAALSNWNIVQDKQGTYRLTKQAAKSNAVGR